MAPAAGEAMSTAPSGELEAASGEHRLAAARGFAESYGRAPEAVWSAPGRVNLIGEHTDYNAGLVLPFAIEQRTVVAAARRDSDVVAVTSTLYAGRPAPA
jgi:galactokinase